MGCPAAAPVFWKGCAAATSGNRFSGVDADVPPGRGLAPYADSGSAAVGKPLLENRRPAAATAAVSVLLALTGVLSLAKGYGLPRYSEAWNNEVQQVQAALERVRLQSTARIPGTIRRHTPFWMRFTADCCTAYRTAWESSLTRTAIWRMQPIRLCPVCFTSAGSNTAARLTADGWSVLYEVKVRAV